LRESSFVLFGFTGLQPVAFIELNLEIQRVKISGGDEQFEHHRDIQSL